MKTLPIVLSSILNILISGCLFLFSFIFLVLLPIALANSRYDEPFHKIQLITSLVAMLLASTIAFGGSIVVLTPKYRGWASKMLIGNAIMLFLLGFWTEAAFLTIPSSIFFLIGGLIARPNTKSATDAHLPPTLYNKL